MAVVERNVSCPSCESVVEVQVDDDRTVVGAEVGHSEDEDALNQLCTDCMDGFHVRLD